MKKYHLWLLMVLLSSCAPQKSVPTPAPLIPIRITYSLNDGILINTHIGQILERTNILTKNGLKGEFFTYPTLRNSTNLAIKEGTDAAFLTTSSSMYVIGKKEKPLYDIVGIQGNLCRMAYIVKTDSPIKNFSADELKGKTISDWSRGACLKWLERQEGNVNPRDFNIKDGYLFGPELEDALANNKIDACATWSPFLEDVVSRKIARILESPFPDSVFSDSMETPSTRKAKSLIILSKKFSTEHPAAAKRFLISIKEAIYFMVTHKELVNGWLAPLFRLDANTIDKASEINSGYKNTKSISDINLIPDDDMIKAVKRSSARINSSKDLAPDREFDAMSWLNLNIAKEAEQEFAKQPYDPSTVKIINKN